MSPPLELSSVLRHRRDVRYRIIDGEAVVIRQEAGEVLGLNEVGARILALVDARSPVGALIDRLAQEFDVSRRDLELDVIEFLRELVATGVLERVGEAPAE